MMKQRFFAVVLAASLGFANSSQAALLVYEPFDYNTGMTLNNVTPNGSTVGLSTTTAYSGNGAQNYTVQAAGLSFAGLPTSGGSVSFGTGTNVAAGQFDLGASPYTGTLFASYLVTLSSRGGAAGNGAGVRVADNNTTGGDRFNIQADSRQETSTEVGINYGASTGGVTHTGVALNLNTTYLIIARFTNVGQISDSNPGIASIYALTEAQFGNFLLGGASESYLDGATIGGGASGITARAHDDPVTTGSIYHFATGHYFALVSVGDAGRFDEVRYGSTLADVTAVPEPSSVLLALGGVAGLLVIQRRRAARV